MEWFGRFWRAQSVVCPFTCRRVAAGERCTRISYHLHTHRVLSCDIRVPHAWARSHLLPRPMEGRAEVPCSLLSTLCCPGNLQNCGCGPSFSRGPRLTGWGGGEGYAEMQRYRRSFGRRLTSPHIAYMPRRAPRDNGGDVAPFPDRRRDGRMEVGTVVLGD